MKDIIRIIKSFEDSDLLMEGVREIIQNEGGFLSMLIGSRRDKVEELLELAMEIKDKIIKTKWIFNVVPSFN